MEDCIKTNKLGNPNLRIVQIMLSDEFGGAERSFVDISMSLELLGHEILAIGSRKSKSLDKLESLGVKTERVSCFGTWDVFTTKSIRKKLNQYEPDIVHCHLARASHLGGFAAKDLGVPVVAKTHNLVDPKYYKNIDKIVVTTEAQRLHLENKGVNSGIIKKIPNFSNVKSGVLRKPYSIDDGLLRVTSLGRFVRKKGFDTLLQAFALINQSDEFNVKLIIGGDGPERKALNQLVIELDIFAKVEFRGWVEDVAEFLKGSDLFVLPSKDEPFGIVILEAMASGIPIVTTKTQGPMEILDENMAVFTEAANARKMAFDILESLQSDNRFKLAELAKTKFDRFYTSEKVTAQYLNLYEELVRK